MNKKWNKKRIVLTKKEISVIMKDAFNQKNKSFWKKEMMVLAKR